MQAVTTITITFCNLAILKSHQITTIPSISPVCSINTIAIKAILIYIFALNHPSMVPIITKIKF